MLSVLEPATEQVLAEVPEWDEAAVASATMAFPAWRTVTPEDQARLLLIAGALEAHAEELARLLARNAGKPIRSARGEIGVVIQTFRYYAWAPERTTGETIPVASGLDKTFREPLWVVGLIVPWNFPLTIACWMVAPALAAGNTVVLKPAALTPLTALELEQGALEAGLPEGGLNVVAGPGQTVDEQLVAHPVWRRSHSPGRQKSGGTSASSAPARSSASRSSSAASRRASSSRTPTRRRPPPPRRPRSSIMPARTAAPAPGTSWSGACLTTSSSCSSAR